VITFSFQDLALRAACEAKKKKKKKFAILDETPETYILLTH
jgi:hypothetical protein